MIPRFEGAIHSLEWKGPLLWSSVLATVRFWGRACRCALRSNSIPRIDRKWRNTLIESDHAATKRLLGYRQSLRPLRTAKTTLSGIETIRTIKRGHIHYKQPGGQGEIAFIAGLFGTAG
ncbi:MAG: DDE-type integrase/transposase/recombinase [Pseudomonadota bacterium]